MTPRFPFIGLISINPMRNRKLNVAGRVGRSKIRGWPADGSLVEIERTGRTCAGTFHDVEVNHGGFNARVSQEDWTVRMSVPDSSRWVAKEWRMVWQVARLGIAALRTASLNCRCMEVSWRW